MIITQRGVLAWKGGTIASRKSRREVAMGGEQH